MLVYKEDIPLLIDHFMNRYGDKKKIGDKLPIDRFLDYLWPGNVRELQNVVHRYISMKKLDFNGSPLSKQNRGHHVETSQDLNLSELTDAYEKDIIQETLDRYQWHRGKAAKALGINRKTLFTKMAKYGMHNTQHETE